MSPSPPLAARELGELRIYLTQADKHPRPGLRGRWFPLPLARVLVDRAHAFGILQATTHTSGYGYVLGGAVRARHLEIESGQLALCVELLDERARLQAFCQRHQALLRGKTLVFRPVEEWTLAPGGPA